MLGFIGIGLVLCCLYALYRYETERKEDEAKARVWSKIKAEIE
jgi:phage gp36-like protein